MSDCCCRKEDGVLRVMEVEFVRITFPLPMFGPMDDLSYGIFLYNRWMHGRSAVQIVFFFF